MPRRGYRKGLCDDRTPLSRRVHTRLPAHVHAALAAEAAARHQTAAAIIRELVVAHTNGTRPHLLQPHAIPAAVLREIARIGNNLNQIAHQANLMRLHLLEHEARHLLQRLRRVLERL